jgi:hypothetical protein
VIFDHFSYKSVKNDSKMVKNGIFGVFRPQIYEKVIFDPKTSKNVIKRPKNAKIAPFLVKNHLFLTYFFLQ